MLPVPVATRLLTMQKPVAPIFDVADDRAQLWPWTVEQYHQLIKLGILPEGEPYELLYGQLVRKDRSATGTDPMTIGHEHAWVVRKLTRLNPRLARLGCHIQIQLPVTLPPLDEPEPDASIVVGSEDNFQHHHPGAADVACVIEVADASLRRDRGPKLIIYANGNIGTYVIINLPDRVIEVYTDPMPGTGSYGQRVTLTRAQKLELPAGKGKRLVIPVRQLLPA
jgi:Uma2 family endonuclease